MIPNETGVNHDRNDMEFSEGRGTSFRSVVCSMCLAAGLATTFRLPREASAHGGLPFLVAYSVMAILMALPIVFLEMALGRLSEQGAVRLWRVVPLLKGLGYIKLFASFLVAVYYIIYLGIMCAMLIWTAKGPVPLVECRELHRAEDGYHIYGIPGQKCLNETFLKPVTDDPMWYGIVAAIMFTLWLLTSLCLIKIPHTYLISLYIFGTGMLILSIALISMEDFKSIKSFFHDVNWDMFKSFELWDSAAIQMLFSTHLGFGFHVTMGGTIYKKKSIFKSALWFMLCNITYSWFSIFLWNSMASMKMNKNSSLLMTLILVYDSPLLKDMNTMKSSMAYTFMIFSGLISVLSLIYPIVWCISLEDFYSKRSVGWLISITGIFCSLSIFILGIDVIATLDIYIIPIYLLSFLSMKLYSLFFIYGLKSLSQDLSFILNLKIGTIPLLFCVFIPMYLTSIIIRRMLKHLYTWPHKYWTFWLMIGMLTLAIVIIVIWGLWVISHKEGYGFWQKMISAMKPSRKWGPEDFKLRYNWMQYKTAKRKFWKNCTETKQCTKIQNNNIRCVNIFPELNKHATNTSMQKILWVTEFNSNAVENGSPQLHQIISNRSYVVGHMNRKQIGHIYRKKDEV